MVHHSGGTSGRNARSRTQTVPYDSPIAVGVPVAREFRKASRTARSLQSVPSLRALRFLLLLAPAFTACTARVETPVAPDDEMAPLACANRVTYLGAGDGLGYPAVYGHATTVATFHYDRGGRILRYRETAADGTTIAQIDRAYESGGRHRPTERTLAAQFRPSPVIFRWTYDDPNRAVRTDDDELIDGRWLRTTAGERYDDDGRIVSAWAAVDHQGDLAFTYPDPNTVLATSPRDGLVQRISLVGGRFVTRTESLYRDRVESVGETTYDASLRPLVQSHTASGVTETTTLEWEAGHVRAVTYHVPNRTDRRVESTYDEAGRLVEKHSVGFDPSRPWAEGTWLAITWDGARVARVVRRKVATRDVVQSWDFEYGCPFVEPSQVTEVVAPVSDWARELDEIPFTYDFREVWAPVSR